MRGAHNVLRRSEIRSERFHASDGRVVWIEALRFKLIDLSASILRVVRPGWGQMFCLNGGVV